MVASGDPEISIHTSDPSASAVAGVLQRVDIALRRAVAASGSDYTVPLDAKAEAHRLPKPFPPDLAGFVITSASKGSLDLVGHFFGEAVRFLNSDTAVALERFATFLVLGGGAWQFFVRRAEQNDPRGPMPIEDIKDIIRASRKAGSDVEFVSRLKQRRSETEVILRVSQRDAQHLGSRKEQS